MPLQTWLELAVAAFAAGAVDAIMGGGGMLQVPALFSLLPGLAPAALLATNKFASLAGTCGAALRYTAALPPRWTVALPAIAAAFAAATLGAYVLTLVAAEPLRKALPFVLVALWIYTATNDLGMVHAPRHAPHREAALAAGNAGAIGFYDGFFGPGAGAFYKLVFVRALGFDFLNAAAPAKLANVASNLAAVLVLAAGGLVLWKLALFLAAANFLGGQVGSRIALRYGNRLIRWAFLLVVAALIAKTFRDAYLVF